MNSLELSAVQALLHPEVQEWLTPEPQRLDAVLTPDHLLAVVKQVTEAHWGYLACITGLDYGAEQGRMEVLYHFCEEAYILTLRVSLARSEAHLPSVCAIIPYASPYERETAEMFGICFDSAPDTRRLFLPDDWQTDLYPLRKDAPLKAEEVKHERS